MNQYISPVRRSIILIIALLSFALFLSGCATVETDLTLYSDDRFEATSRITASVEGVVLAGGVEAIESQFKEMEQRASAEGARFSWRKGSSRNTNEVVYHFSIGGTGYENLAGSYGINIQKTQYQGQDALSISASPNYDSSGVQNTVRVHVGKILQTNNQRSGNNTIVWTGAESLQAIVTPASSTNWLPILLVVLATVAALTFIVLRRRPVSQVATVTSATTTAPIMKTGAFCPHCGQPTQPGAKFCMSCGQAIPPRQG